MRGKHQIAVALAARFHHDVPSVEIRGMHLDFMNRNRRCMHAVSNVEHHLPMLVPEPLRFPEYSDKNFYFTVLFLGKNIDKLGYRS